MREATLMAQPFNVDRLELTGEAGPLADDVQIGGGSGRTGGFSVSQAGVLIYQTDTSMRSQLTWFDRTGREIAALGDPADYAGVELSPDGTRATVIVQDPARNTGDLWVYELARGLRSRFTFDVTRETRGVWSPDASRIAFGSNRRDFNDIYQKPSSGVGSEDVLLQTDLDQEPTSWSRDGQLLLYQTGGDIWVLPLFGDRKPFPVMQTQFNEVGGRLSGDGRWIAYTSNESGRVEVYAASFPKAGGKWQVSTSGGRWPRWRDDGKEIFYLAPDNTLMTAEVMSDGAASSNASRQLIIS
jgi:Tol biopolymer transport system component